MGIKCAMPGCNSSNYRGRDGHLLHTAAGHYHRFPKNPERLKKWMAICKNPKITTENRQYYYICCKHFDDSSYGNTHKKLLSTALPNKYLPEGTPTTKERKKKRTTLTKEIRTKYGVDAKTVKDIDTKYGVDAETVKDIDTKYGVDAEIVEDTENEAEEDGDSVAEVLLGSSETKSDSTQLDQSADSTDSSQTYQPRSKKKKLKPSPKVSDPVLPNVVSLAGPSTSKEETDDCATFADFLKTRMRKFDVVQKSIAQKLISDILFMADTNQLQFGTVVMNPQQYLNTPVQVSPNVNVQDGNNFTPAFTGSSVFTHSVRSTESEMHRSPLVRRRPGPKSRVSSRSSNQSYADDDSGDEWTLSSLKNK